VVDGQGPVVPGVPPRVRPASKAEVALAAPDRAGVAVVAADRAGVALVPPAWRGQISLGRDESGPRCASCSESGSRCAGPARPALVPLGRRDPALVPPGRRDRLSSGWDECGSRCAPCSERDSRTARPARPDLVQLRPERCSLRLAQREWLSSRGAWRAGSRPAGARAVLVAPGAARVAFVPRGLEGLARDLEERVWPSLRLVQREWLSWRGAGRGVRRRVWGRGRGGRRCRGPPGRPAGGAGRPAAPAASRSRPAWPAAAGTPGS
jgi:hypothetical protein